ncbi:uncharacterized protein BDR25DRAFT_305597 [Lindgomyces ingoldianus]|uniref:Uncharacterized protein n=1 Tax=Lindgomyces ingoldianus TaxID=673940 RepID=A0ACB6QKP2_9PLEO|nr:uncharacterized protein BDR25DRAFT_305597 [Lindgomyces ingoldianus]KAF2467584.1 hypothetical protein BDR25DRAFT_305597 [Lindgomyces ingoldianus]
MSYGAPTITHTPTSDPNPMDRTHSAPAAVPMNRSASSLSFSNIVNSNGLGQRSISAMSASSPLAGHQVSEYSLYSESLSTRSRPSLQTIDEISTFGNNGVVEYDPTDYINYLESSTSPSFPSQQDLSRQLVEQLTQNPLWSPSSDGSASPSTVSTATLMTPATRSSSTMSYQNSFNNQLVCDLSMMRVSSDCSSVYPVLTEDTFLNSFASDVDTRNITSDIDPSPFPNFTGPSSETVSPPAHVSSSVSTLTSFKNQSCLAEDMRRSTSYESESDSSSASASSTSSRHSQRNREVITQASRPIAPKAIENDETRSPSSNVQMKQMRSADGSSKDVALITKAPYSRPKHEKVKCPHCDENANGFRGPHELDRHKARAHAQIRKGFICYDSSPDKKFLANCKHCRNQKIYGAYYNAAAHLRRFHFHPKKQGRKGKHDERRGGSGGGNDPPMDYLKQHWIHEVDVRNEPKQSKKRAVQQRDSDNIDSNVTVANSLGVNTYDASYPSNASQPIDLPNMNMSMVEYNTFADCSLYMNSNDNSYNPSAQLAAYNDKRCSSTSDFNDFQFDAENFNNYMAD